MGRVVVKAEVESLEDLLRERRGEITRDQIRRLVIDDALVDTGATSLSMPRRMIEALGLLPFRKRVARTTSGLREFSVYGAVRLVIDGRECSCDVTELDDDCPVLIGQVPLELLDFLVDPARQRLIGNPAHGGQQMLDMY
jgi:predicted aspartyl protease